MRLALPLSFGVAVVLSVLGGVLWRRSPGPAPSAAGSSSAAPPVVVDTFEVASQPFSIQVQASGTLLARESVDLVSELSRRLVKVRADEGSAVARGDVLFELDSADLHAELGKLQVQARLAKATLERGQRLLREGLSTQQDLDGAQASFDTAEAQRRVLLVTLGKTLIRAPFAGRLGLRRVSVGAWLSPNTVLATLQDTQTLKLDFTLPERYAGLVAVGGEFSFKTAGRGEVFSGRVEALEPKVDQQTRSLLVRGVIQNQPSLLPGTFASVELPLRVEAALMVPSIAVVPGVEGRRVFVVQGDVVRSVAVEVGARTAERVQILTGLKAGDRVVISNLLRIKDGGRVRVAPQGSP